MKTLQEIFDTAYLGLAKQGFQTSINDDETCVYRGPDGMKCAIGHCILDNDYRGDMDNSECPWGYGDFAENGFFKGISGEDFSALQKCHDDAETPFGMRRALKVFAAERGLTVPQVEGQI